MVILRASSFLKGHKNDTRVTSRITPKFNSNLSQLNSDFKRHITFGVTQEKHKGDF
jgi:hypothetical protein